MSAIEVFQLQFLMSLLVFTLLAWVFARPQLAKLDRRRALLVLTAPHMFRHIGMIFVVPGLVSPDMPESFAVPAAYGDLTTGVLAIVAFIALAANVRVGVWLAALFNVVGLVDLAKALPQLEVAQYFEVAWYVPTVLVPLLLVTHGLSVLRLLRGEAAAKPTSAGQPLSGAAA